MSGQNSAVDKSEYREIVQFIDQERDRPGRENRFEDFRRAVADMDVEFPDRGRGIVLVAGTNGKGSVSKMLETMLTTQHRVGLYTSPHLMEPLERIRSGGEDLTADEFVAAFRAVEPIVARYGLSHFEILTLMMIEIFFGGRIRPRVDLAVIEVGVGGRLDPTRAVPHGLSVITKIGLDHQELLGDTLVKIAREKFAIVEPGQSFVYAPLPDALSLQDVSADVAGAIEAEYYPSHIRKTDAEPAWSVETPWGEGRLSLLGERAVENASIALQVHYEILRQGWLPSVNVDQAMRAALASLTHVKWPARMERIALANDRSLYLSGDHNPQGAESLREILEHFEYEKLHLVVGMGKNKDAQRSLEILSRLRDIDITLTMTPFRGGGSEIYGSWLQRAAGGFFDDPVAAVKSVLRRADHRDLVVVTGSLYLVGDLRRQLLADPRAFAN